MGRGKGVVVAVAGLVLAVAGCGGGGTDEKTGKRAADAAESKPSRAPSGKLVQWAGKMCESAVALKELRADSAADLKEIRDSDDETGLLARSRAVHYLFATPSDVETAASDLDGLGPSGVPAADRLLAAWQKKVKGVATELDEVSPAVPLEQAEATAADVDKKVQSLTPPQPDLPALARKDPRLAAAYERAEQCAPGWKPHADGSPAPGSTGPLPEAADGKDYAACSDGACEVLVTSTAEIRARGKNLHVSVSGDSVTFQSDDGSLAQLGGAGGEAGFGDAVKATVVAHNEDGAVIEFARP
ncbi:hypothetical protein [Streptomyces sp. NPDC029041]|uniref:hypothetical protein n=1 Tax=Streptomyces sp. NPDC029041 TaxID=3155727 RepID=UPI0033EF5B13